jgi:hypothetical protein
MRANGASSASATAEVTTTAMATAFSRRPGGALVSVPRRCKLELADIDPFYAEFTRECTTRGRIAKDFVAVGVAGNWNSSVTARVDNGSRNRR